MKRFFGWLHLWLSVPFGLIIAAICFSGAMLVFEDEIVCMTHGDMFFVKRTAREPLPAGIVVEKAAGVLPEGVAVTGLTVFADRERCYRVDVSKPARGAVFVNQYTGEVTGFYERTPFFKAMFGLHRWLLDSRPSDGGVFLGKLAVGVATLFFVVILVSGVVMWWPRSAGYLRRKLSIRVSSGWYRFWYGLHAAGGMYAVAVLLVLALTGLTWSFDWYREGFYRLFGAEVGPRHGAANAGADRRGADRNADADGRTLPFACAQTVLDSIEAENPDFKMISVGEGSARVYFDGPGNSRAADRYFFDVENGKLTGAAYYADTERAGKLRGWIYSIHVGSWGGIATKIVVFAAALLGGSLPLTGYYLWVKRLVRKRKRAGGGYA